MLESLRQPIESGRAVVARAKAHVAYPARVQLIAAMNPCRRNYLADAARVSTLRKRRVIGVYCSDDNHGEQEEAMSEATDKAAGGCMCGAVRYEATGEPFSVTHCHCSSCRRHTGAPVVTLLGYKADQVNFTGDERKIYESSPGVGRAFCGNCGTPLTWEGDGGELGPLVEVHISTLDAPDGFVPTSHAFHPERIAWFDIADGLPRYAGFAGDSETIGHGPVSEGLPG